MDNILPVDPSSCSLFRPWKDPQTGITSYILAKRVAPTQQSFYFANKSFTDDGRYLWFYCAHPPGGNSCIGRTLGVVDLRQENMHWFPETQFRDASPFVDVRTGDVYWCWDYSVYRRGPDPDVAPQLVNSLPASIHRSRPGWRLATHLTLSADRKEFFIDAHLGREFLMGSLPLDGGEFQPWQTFERCYNHAQFSPTDPDLALIAQDNWRDVVTGMLGIYDNRIWLIRRGAKAQPIFANAANAPEGGWDPDGKYAITAGTVFCTLAHEWWDPDGKHIWYVDYQKGTEKVDIRDGRKKNVWPNGTCHSHSSSKGEYLVGDIGTYTWRQSGCRVAFFNVKTGREINIVSSFPPPVYNSYHIQPHPQFAANDQLIVYTTTVLGGQADVAVARTEELIRATG